MTTFDILAKFLEMYPQFHEQLCQYAPGGFNRIIVWFRNGQIFDFTYFNDQKWSLTNYKKPDVNSYIGRYMR
jgi:hypothetical protein